jgi:uncharacterized membrane protein
MISFSNSVTIKRPVEEVFAYLADVPRQTEWSSAVQSIRLEELEPVRQGSRYWQTVKMLGRQAEALFEVSEYEEGRKIGFRSLSGAMPIAWSMTLTPVSEGTRIEAKTRGEPGGVFKLAAPLMDRAMRRQAAGDFATLKDLLETREALAV